MGQLSRIEGGKPRILRKEELVPAMSFPQATFLAVVKNMLGVSYDEINTDVQDAAAELTNIVYGQRPRRC